MSSFDTTLTPMGLQLAVPSPDEINPEMPMIQIVVPVGTIIPIDTGNGQPLPLPLGVYRIPVHKELAINFAKNLLQEAEKLPDPVKKPDIAIPGGPLNEEQLRRATQAEQQFRGKG